MRDHPTLVAVRKNGWTLRYVPEFLKVDREFLSILAAVRQNEDLLYTGNAVEYSLRDLGRKE